jgi:hypothetical protein
MQSSKKRIATGLKMLADLLTSRFDIPIHVNDQPEAWQFLVCRGDKGTELDSLAQPAAWFLSGMLQEYLLWAGGGKIYPIAHPAPFLAGRTGCIDLSISKKPLS